MSGILNEFEIDALLNQQFIGRIGCCFKDSVYIVPIGYAYDDTYIYGHSHEGRKLKMMRENPKVCFEVEDISEPSNWRSAIVWGTFEELISEHARIEALRILTSKSLPVTVSKTAKVLPDYPFFSEKENAVEGILYRIKIERKTGRFEKYEL